MKQLLALLLLTAATLQGHAQVSFGQTERINDGWRFLRADANYNISEDSTMALPSFDDSRWRTVSLPHDWSAELLMSPDKASCQGYKGGGVAWYRKTLPHPISRHGQAGDADKRFFIYFEGVYNHSEVYLNGQLLGKRPSGFASFLYDLTPYLRPDGPNIVALRVDHSEEADSRWYTGSGIYRNVWLVTAPQVHLAQWGSAYRLKRIDSSKAVVEVDIATTDEQATKGRRMLKAVAELLDADGKRVAQTQTAIGSDDRRTVLLTVKKPQRWSLEHPYLYRLVTRLYDGGVQTDGAELPVGLRTLSFTPDKGFALNGVGTKVKGVCLHDDAGVLGTAVPKDVWRLRLQRLKQLGVNAIRMSHNPHAPMIYDLCDEIGLLVMDEASDEWEFPKRKWRKGWNKGVPGYEGTFSYFDEWIERDVADMVRRDRHHPSIFLWSIGNEVDYPNDPYSHPVLDGSSISQPMYGGYRPEQPHAERIGHIAKRLSGIVRGIDSSRPVTGALAGVVMSNETLYPEVIDVVGYNYTEDRYQADHERYPERIIYGSENRHDLKAWHAVKDNDYIFGQFLWTGTDYLGESHPWPSRGFSSGLLDLKGETKPLGWYRASLWSDKPFCRIVTAPAGKTRAAYYAAESWNYAEGDSIVVSCFSNADRVRLLLNGTVVSQQLHRDEATNAFVTTLPFTTGKLCAEAIEGGNVVASHTIESCGVPHSLRVAFTDRGDEVVQVVVEVVDDRGVPVPQADNLISCSIKGDAELLGLENGDINDASQTHSQTTFKPLASRRAFGGRLLAYVRRPATAGATITFTSPLLQPCTVALGE